MALIPQSNGIPKNTNPPKVERKPEPITPVKIVTETVKSVEPAPIELKQTKKKK